MSPQGSVIQLVTQRVPRASGDEPNLLTKTAELVECSPRERG